MNALASQFSKSFFPLDQTHCAKGEGRGDGADWRYRILATLHSLLNFATNQTD